ncbi:MAG: hypothetical protein ACK50J_04385 [Planctomyces sp.]
MPRDLSPTYRRNTASGNTGKCCPVQLRAVFLFSLALCSCGCASVLSGGSSDNETPFLTEGYRRNSLYGAKVVPVRAAADESIGGQNSGGWSGFPTSSSIRKDAKNSSVESLPSEVGQHSFPARVRLRRPRPSEDPVTSPDTGSKDSRSGTRSSNQFPAGSRSNSDGLPGDDRRGSQAISGDSWNPSVSENTPDVVGDAVDGSQTDSESAPIQVAPVSRKRSEALEKKQNQQGNPETASGMSASSLHSAESEAADSDRQIDAETNQAVSDNPSNDVESAEEPSGSAPQPTMLNRLKGLYPAPLEENPGQLIRKQFRRIPGPWGLLKEKPPENSSGDEEKTADAATDEESREAAAGASSSDVETEGSRRPLDRRSAVAELILAMEEDLRQWPRDESGERMQPEIWTRRQAELRLLYLIADRSGDAVSVIESLPPEEQELWQSMVMAMDRYLSGSGSPLDQTAEAQSLESSANKVGARSREERLTATAEQLRAAVRHAQALSPLTIRRADFCSEIHGFGSIEELPGTTFSAGQPVLIYLELDNFRTERTESGTYRSKFSAILEIQRSDEHGDQLIEAIPVESIEDEATTRRTDFYQSYELTIPSHLAEGRYQIRITVRDLKGSQQAVTVLPFAIRSALQ